MANRFRGRGNSSHLRPRVAAVFYRVPQLLRSEFFFSNATKCAVHSRPLEYFSRDRAGAHANRPVSHVLPCLARAWGANFNRRARITWLLRQPIFSVWARRVTLRFALERFAPGTSMRIAI